MGHTCNAVTIAAPYEKVFDVSNDIARWTELFGGEYVRANVLERRGNRIDFELTNREGATWRSYRLLYKEHGYAYAKRVSPLAPFKYMDIVWLYREQPGGVQMTWIQDFEMAPGAKHDDATVERFVDEHSRHNMQIIKRVLEGR